MRNFLRPIPISSALLVLLMGLGVNNGTLKAQPIPFDWRSPTVPNASYGDDARDIVVDTVNNYIYAVGVVYGGAPYGLQAFNGSTARKDGFLIKLNLDGSLVWAKTLGGTGSDELNAVAIGPDGNIYVTGSFQNSISLSNALNSAVSISSAGGSDIMVASYRSSDGALNWMKAAAGSTGDDKGTGIVALPSGVFITGDYQRRIYFNGNSDPTSETHNSKNAFIAKYSLTGTFVASCSGGTEGNDYAGKLATDGTSIYTIGTFKEDEDFRWRNPNGTTATYWEDLSSENNMFVLSVDLSCVLNWARYIINPGSSNITVGAIAADQSSCGNIYLAGATHNNTKFPSFGTTSLAGAHDFLFLAALAKTNGNTEWLRTARGPVNHANTGLDIDVGPKGEVYMCGTYTNQITWDDGTTASGSSGKEMFAARFTSYGETEWFLPITAANDDVLQAIAVGKNGAVFGGGYSNTLDLIVARATEVGPPLWPANPSSFNLPATRCRTAGSINLNSLIIPFHGGNAVSVVSNTGLSNLSSALGIPDGNGIQFNTNGSTLVVDLGEELDAGGTVQLVWRKATGASGTAKPRMEVSLNGTTWTAVLIPPTTASETFTGGNFELPIAARYVRVQKDNSLSSTSFILDGLQFKSGAFTGGTWSGPGVSSSTFNPAGLTGPHSITYTVSCYTTTKVIQIDPPSVGGTLSGGGSACSGAEMELALAGNTGTTIIWNVSTNGGTTWVDDTTGLNTYAVTAMLQATRVRVRSISGSCAAATSNTVQVVAADIVAPVISGCPGNVTAYMLATSSTAAVAYTIPTATDNCPGPLTIIPQNPAHASGSQFPRGNTAVIIRASDDFGNVSTCAFTIQVIDTVKPNITCPVPVAVNTNTGCTAINVVLGTPVASDNSGTVTVTNNAPSIFPAGITNVIWIATDASGNTRSCTQQVTVTDNAPPSITCPGNRNVIANAGCAATGVNLGTPVTADNCAISMVFNNATPSFPFGNTSVTWTVMDNAGNTNTCTQQVTVTDNTPPTITCPAAVQVNTTAGCTAVNVVLGIPVASDNCDVVSLTSNAPSIFPIGTTTVIWTALDASGNTATCTQTVTVTDNTPPTLSCPANVQATTNTGCTATGVALGTPTATDNCTGVTVTNNAPSAFPKGITTVTWTATDASGNSATCTQTVTVIDNILPTIICPPNVQAQTNAGCTATAVVLGTPTASDNCTGVTITSNAPAIFPIGNTTVTWTATDANGNAATCTQIVTVTDNILPTITCPPNVQAQMNTGCTATGVNLGTATYSDNCSGVTVSNNAPAAFPKGTTSVMWTATDASGNTATCTQVVTVTDNILPAISCPPNVQAHTNTNCNATGVNLGTATASDNCTGVLVTNNAPSAFPKGITTVTWTATDASGNTATCTQIVTVTDDILPTITCPPNVQAQSNSGCAATGVNLGTANASDNCNGVALTNNAPAAFPIGTTTVTWTATDASGNIATCNQTVTVADAIAPVISGPANVQVDANIGCTTTGVDLGTPAYSDNCTGTTLSNNAPSVFPLGTTTVTWTATDASGNSSTSTHTVTVKDHTDPVALCREVTVNVDGTGWAHVTAAMVNDGSSDNCMLSSMSVSPQDFNSLGDYEVTLTVTDAAGNSAICSTIVHVVDNSPPIAICTDVTVYLDLSGEVSITALELDGGSTDNGSIVGFIASQTHFTCADLGMVADTLFVTDNGGNTSFCIAQVTVIDTVTPVALGQNILVYLGTSGEATITASELNNGSSDACGNLSFSASDTAFNCADIGVVEVLLTVTDASGNIASVITQLTVQDTIAPMAQCQSATLYMNATGIASVSPVDVDGGSTDNCTITSRVVLPSVVQGAGDHNIQLIVTDGSGNSDTCMVVVIVLDTVAPVALCRDTLVQLGTSGTVNLNAIDLNGGSTDNDGITQWAANQLVFGCADIGVNTDTLFVTDGSGNTSFCLSTITVIDPYPAIAGVDSTADFCVVGTSASLFPYLGSTAQTGGSWWFQGQPNSGLFDPTQNAPGAYLYTVTNASGCQLDSSMVTTVLLAMGNPGQDTSITFCSSDTAFALTDLLPGADANGTWSNTTGWFDPATDVAGGIIYTVDGPSVCPSATATISVQVNAAPNAGPGGSLALCADASPASLFAALQGGPDAGGQWTDPLGESITGLIEPSTMGAGSYTYTVTGLTPCGQASSTVVVSLTPQPSAAWSAPDPICASGTPLDLDAFVTGVPDGTWSGPGVNGGSSQFYPGNVTLQGASTPIELTYTAMANGCQASAVGTIIVLASPVADAGDEASVCGLETNMNASADYGSGHWSANSDVDFGSADASNTAVQVTAPGTFEMHWTVTNGQCTSIDNVLVTFHIPEQLGEVNAGSDESWNIKRSFQLQGFADGATETRWTLLDGSGYIQNAEELSTEVRDLEIGSNTFMLSARVGACPFIMDTVVLVIRDLFIPSGYSPNGDGVNDNFEIIGIDVYRDNELTVLNRWGQVVYQTVGYANEWNGQGNTGSPLLDDTYFYMLKFNGDATYNGQVIIKR